MIQNMSILDAMLRIQPETELNKLYSLNNSSGQLKWHMDDEFKDFWYSIGGFGVYYSDLINFFFNKGMLFEFCLAVEGCKNYGIDHESEWCEKKVAKTLNKVR